MKSFASCLYAFAFLVSCANVHAAVYTKGTPGVATGGSRYSIPIQLPPAGGKVEPAFSLDYSSFGGNGYLGQGWSLQGLSDIARCPLTIASEGKPGAVSLTANDRFCIDGAKLVVQGSGAYGADQTEYRTEVESFAKILSYGAAGSGPAYFRVWTKDGLIREYGNGLNSQALAPGTTTAYRWSLNRVQDRSGNFYTITYSQNVTTGEFYPTRVDYSANSVASTGHHSSLRLMYEVRPDPQSRFVASSKVDVTQRISKIQTYTKMSGVDTLVREYRLTYDTGAATGASRLITLTECAADNSCLVPTTVSWFNGGGGITGSAATSVQLGLTDAYIQSDSEKLYTGDFNGDGVADIYIFSPSGPKICYGPSFTPSQCHSIGFSTPFDVGDFNGDGITDFAVIGTDGYLRVCAGPNFGSGEQSCAPSGSPTLTGWRLVAGDFNGDGISDVYVWPSDPNGNVNVGKVCNGYELFNPIADCGHSSVSLFNDQTKIVKGDFDGDGRLDLLVFYDGQMRFCAGADLMVTGVFPGNCSGPIATSTNWRTNAQLVVGDFNGDGKSDLIAGTQSGLMFCPGPLVSSFSGCNMLATGDWSSGVKLVAGDFNGDRISDLVVLYGSNVYHCRGPGITLTNNCTTSSTTTSWATAAIKAGDFNGDSTSDLFVFSGGVAYTSMGAAGQPDLAQTIGNGVGAFATFSYLPLTSSTIYTKGTGGVYPNIDVQLPSYVVSSWCVSDGGAGSECNGLSYSSAIMNLQGRGFAGFKTIVSNNTTLARVTTTSFRQDFPFFGLVNSEAIAVNGETLSTRSNSYVLGNSFRGTSFPVLSERLQIVRGLDGIWKNERFATGQDAYGNSVGGVTYFGDGSTNSINYSGQLNEFINLYYANDEANWLLGQLTRNEVIRRIYPSSGPMRTTTYTYVPGTLLIASEVREPSGDAALTTSAAYTRDVFGNVLTQTKSAAGVSSQVQTWTYDSTGRFAISESDAMSHSASLTFDPRFGALTSRTDPNGLTGLTNLDGFGRVALETHPDGSTISHNYSACPGCLLPTTLTPMAWYESVTRASETAVYRYYDQRDRLVKTISRNFANTDWNNDELYEYNPRGLLARSYVPHDRLANPRYYSQYAYDDLGRTTSENRPTGFVTSTTYAFNVNGAPTITRSNSDGTVVETMDSQGRPISRTDQIGASVAKAYDVWGNLTSQAMGSVVVTSGYDLYGRRTSLSDPDRGTWTFTFDGLDRLTTQIDGRGIQTSFTYDALQRKTAEVAGSATRSWSYDSGAKAIGKLSSSASSDSIARSYGYDMYGRPSSVGTSTGSGPLTAALGYDAAGRVNSIQYPSGFAVQRNYAANGALAELRDSAANSLIWRANVVDTFGVLDEDFGNGTGTTHVLNQATGRPTQIATTRDSDSSLLQDLTFSYDDRSRLTSRGDSSQSMSEGFGYDALSRLSTVTGPSARTYSYSVGGSIASQTGLGSYSYGDPARPHAVTSIGSTTFTYDANGNALTAGARTLSWTPFNSVSIASQGANSFAWSYDADGRRGKMTTASKTRAYLYLNEKPLYEQLVVGSAVTGLHYIYAEDNLVAMRSTTQGSSTMSYVVTDQMGSYVLATNPAGTVVDRGSYEAFGKRRFANGMPDTSNVITSGLTPRGFTMHEHLDEIALINMNGRLYDPATAKMLSADADFGGELTSLQFDRYAYVSNRPLFYVDPNGQLPIIIPVTGCCRPGPDPVGPIRALEPGGRTPGAGGGGDRGAGGPPDKTPPKPGPIDPRNRNGVSRFPAFCAVPGEVFGFIMGSGAVVGGVTGAQVGLGIVTREVVHVGAVWVPIVISDGIASGFIAGSVIGGAGAVLVGGAIVGGVYYFKCT